MLSFLVPTNPSAKSNKRSVASALLLRITSSTCSKRSFGISEYTSNMAGFTIPIFIPALIAWYKNTECMASRTGLFPLKLKDTLLTPPLTDTPGRFSLTHWVALIKSTAFNVCSSIPVATGNIFKSKIISWAGKSMRSTNKS